MHVDDGERRQDIAYERVEVGGSGSAHYVYVFEKPRRVKKNPVGFVAKFSRPRKRKR